MIKNATTDITGRTNEAAVTALCSFGETVATPAGRIDPAQAGFTPHVEGRKPREFATASGAVEVLRRLTK